jgi:hypothetical protein
MAEATDQQMQQYANERVRVRAEQCRALVNALNDDKLAIDDVFERAVGANPWADARTDGPPSLLNQQDILTYNAVATILLKCVDGTATLQEVSDLSANWPAFQSACVRPVNN